jgi:hypothetical protein
MRRHLAAAAVVIVAAAVVAVPATSATATATHDESITIVVAGPPGTAALVIARGPVNDVGSLTPNDSDTDTLAFPGGTLLIQESGTTTFQPPAPPSCLARFTTTGTYTVVGGTGRFRHAAGRGTTVDSGIELTSQSPTGCIGPALFVYDKAEFHGTLITR